MCIVTNDFSGFTQYLLFIQSNESGLFQTGYFTTDVYNVLHNILVFLTNIPNQQIKENIKTLWIQTLL